jgi:O-antigen ligase
MKKNKIILCSFLIFYIYFFRGTYIGLNSTISGWLTNGCFLLLAVLLWNSYKHFWDKEYRVLNLAVLGYCVVSILSVEKNIDYINSLNVLDNEGFYITGQQSAKSVVYSSIGLVMSALFIERLVKWGKVNLLLKTLLVCIGILLIFVDIDALQHIVINDDIEGYLIGNKFNVCYLNLYFCAIYYMLHPKLDGFSKYWLLVFLAILVIVSAHTQCSTTIVGALTFIVLVFLVHGRFKKTLSRPVPMLIALLVCDVAFFFFSTWFLQFDFIQDFIVNVLHEDMTLTGRLGIYLNIQDAFDESPWIGYGIGNSGIISRMYTGAYDAQNGMVDMFLQVGIVGCLLYVFILFMLFKQIRDRYECVFPTVVLVYSVIIISMVEIPFKHVFLLLSFFLLIKESLNSKGDTVTSHFPKLK